MTSKDTSPASTFNFKQHSDPTLSLLLAQSPRAEPSKGCSRCGIEGVHACPGAPIVWTEEDKARLKEALSTAFGWDKKTEKSD